MNLKQLALAAAAVLLLAPTVVTGQARKPRVTVIGTGGTISGESKTRTSFQNYRAGQKTIEEMVDFLRPQIDSVAEVTTIQFGNKGSGGYDIPDYYDLTMAVEKALQTADAVVVTTGTGTMDEFVYWSELTVQSPKPVVYTGAMRPWTVLGTDGPANLFNAIVLAASGETRCMGSVLMLNDQFHAAKEVWKSDSARLDTFIDRGTGSLGTVDDLVVHTWRAPPRFQFCNDATKWSTPYSLSKIEKGQLPRVEAFMGGQETHADEAVKAVIDGGAKGIILAMESIKPETRKYGTDRGVVFIGTQRFRSALDNIMPEKARLALILAIAYAKTPEEATKLYQESVRLEWGEQKPITRPSGLPAPTPTTTPTGG